MAAPDIFCFGSVKFLIHTHAHVQTNFEKLLFCSQETSKHSKSGKNIISIECNVSFAQGSRVMEVKIWA